MDLRDIPTDDLRRELRKREEAERVERWDAVKKQFPCPTCGADPQAVDKEIVEEYRQAPRDEDGIPMIYMPYEAGETTGAMWETRVTCVNGHVTATREASFYPEPIKGPPLLPH